MSMAEMLKDRLRSPESGGSLSPGNPLTATGADVAEAGRLCDDALLGIGLALAEAEFPEPRLVRALLIDELGRSVRRTFARLGGAGAQPGGTAHIAGGGPWLRRGPLRCLERCCPDCCCDVSCEACCESCGECDCCGACCDGCDCSC
jgi:hypothetical protein